MENKSFRELYEAAKTSPTPPQAFLEEVAALTHRSAWSVKQWAVGRTVPDDLVQSVIAERFGTAKEALFPEPGKRCRPRRTEDAKAQ